MRVAFLLVSILFALAVAEQQQQEPQPSYDESQASYGPYFYHPAERQFVPSNAKWFIRTTTTSTSTSTSTTTCTLSTASICSGRRRRGIFEDIEEEAIISPSKVESLEVTPAPDSRITRKADPQLMLVPARYASGYQYQHAVQPYEQLYPTFGPYQGYYGPGMFMPYSNPYLKSKPVAVVEGGNELSRLFFTLTFTTTTTTFTVSTSTSTPSCSVASSFAQCPTGK